MFLTRPFRTSLLAIAAAGALVAACSDDDNNAPPDIAMSLVPTTVSVAQGTIGSSTAIVTKVSSTIESISMSATGAPTGVDVSFVPELLPDGSYTARIVLDVGASATLGTYDLKIKAEAAGASATSTLTLTVVAPGAGSFTFKPDSATLTVLSEAPTSTNLVVTRTAPFTGPVTFSVSGLPPGMTATLTPASVTGTSTKLELAMAPGAEGGRYTITIRATGEGVPDQVYRMGLHSYNASDPAHGGDHGMTLAPTPATMTLTAGGPSDTATVAITRVGDWSGAVDFELWSLPSLVTGRVVPPEGVLGTEALVILQAGLGATPGTYTVTVFGNSTLDWLYDTTTITVTVVGGV